MLKRILSLTLIFLHLATFGPGREALAFISQSASYKLTSGIAQGGQAQSSISTKLPLATIGEPILGKSTSANFTLTSGFVATLQSNPPVLTQKIPFQTWQKNTKKESAFDLDNYFSSPDGSSLTYTVSGNSNIKISIDPATHIVSFEQPEGYIGFEKVYFTATDSEYNSTKSNKVALRVEDPIGPDKPAIIDMAVTPSIIKEGGTITLFVTAQDPDAGNLVFTYNNFFTETRRWQENGFWYSEATWQTGANSNGHYLVKVTVTDPTGLSDTDEITINIGNSNNPPVISPIADITVNEGQTAVINPQATDADSDPIVFYFSSPFNTQGYWLTDYKSSGTYNIIVTASDGIDTTSTTCKVTINNINGPPEVKLELSKYTVSPNEQFDINITASDPDNDTLTYIIKKDTTELESGNITNTHTANTSFTNIGDHKITVIVTDINGLSTTKEQGVDVVDPNADRNAINPIMGDFNGDALTDLGLHNSDSGTWEICLSDKGIFRNAVDWTTGFGNSRDWWPIGGDFNADGKSDIGVYNNATGELKIAYSTGSSFTTGTTVLTVPFASYSWQPVTSNFNADKYTDFALYNKDTGEIKVALGSATGFGEFATWATLGTGYTATSGDFNGDGLSDILLLKKQGGEVRVAFSNTSAFVDETNWASGFASEQDIIPADFNNDGLTDLGYWDKSGNWYYALSTGNKFIPQADKWLESFGSSNDESATVGDFNGDGVTDAACFDRDDQGINRWNTKLSTNKPADLLTDIDNGIGGKTKIVYTYAATGDNPVLPFPVYVANSVSSINTIGLSPATYTQNFIFSGGYYDALEREFRGFAKVTVKDPITKNYSETYFYQGKTPEQDGALKGQIEKIISYDGNNCKISESINTYEVKKSGSSTNLLGFPYVKEQNTTVWEENTTSLSTKQTFDYDNIGNVITTQEYGDLDKTGDEKSILTNYAQAYTVGTNGQGFNRPTETILKDKDLITVSRKTFEYDIKGNLFKEILYITNPITSTQTTASTTYFYDMFGNLTTTTNAKGNSVITEYETEFYTYPSKVSNALDQSIEYTYDTRFGAVKTVKDTNGVVTRTSYDSLGRVEYVKNAKDEITTSYSYPDFNTKITTKPGGFYSKEYIDGLGRKYKTVSQGEDGTGPREVTSEVYFNNRGLNEKESLAHYIDESEDNISYIVYEYDIRGRVKKTISDFPGTLKDAEASVSYITPVYTETTDPRGKRKGTLKDINGNPIEITEFTSDGIFKTKYDYDIQNNLIKTTDHYGNITQIFYDSSGKKLKMIDPDMGTWSYEYDELGNLVKQTDAKNQVITFEYDVLNRLVNKQMSDVGGQKSEVSYIYDDTSKPNCIGRLSKVNDGYSKTEFFYDILGRETKSTKTINDTDSFSYTVEREYDILDRLTKLTYPDGEVVNYAYDTNSGLLEKVYNNTNTYVKDITYNAKGQIKNISYGNNTKTEYTYGQDLRLSRIQTTEVRGQTNLQDLNYDFDSNGNITTLTDNLTSNIRQYDYDDLDRLIQARNTPSPQGGYTDFYFRYDAIGNMTYKSDIGEMRYESSRPHAVTSANGYSYDYDANGNMISHKGRRLIYDLENRLTHVVNGPWTEDYMYDGDGGRVRKSTYDNTGKADLTTYIGSLYEVRSTTDSPKAIVKHIFAGANRVCTVTKNEGGGTKDVSFYHSDHLGSSNVITDANGNLAEHYEYMPYGQVASSIVSRPSSLVTHKFTGKELDASGLYFYGARYYDPEIGRFITTDTIVQAPYDPQSLNRYSYCRNNPLNYVDPTGHSWFSKFWKAIFQPVISFIAAVVTVFFMPSFAPLIAQYGFMNVAGTVGASAAGASGILGTGEGRKFTKWLGKEVFDDILGMPPGVANFFSSLVSHTVLASGIFMGLSSITMPANTSGPNYTKPENQGGEFADLGKDIKLGRGGSSANYLKSTVEDGSSLTAKFDYTQQGLVASDIAFKGTPGVEQVMSALNIRHTAALVNFNGKLWDSAVNTSLISPLKGAIYAMPWTATCHQATFNSLMAGGMSAAGAFGATLSQGTSSYVISTSIYGINGGFGMSGIANAEVDKK
ncbi:MAG: FG-GAP-like repeat-containing protein [Candidatus Omnitrophica bacterium]|jgi:RHS repeat-associated protein|nr:FG-GAP-like repeat-containing protein [Candidatus Omnitrophota bacterium]